MSSIWPEQICQNKIGTFRFICEGTKEPATLERYRLIPAADVNQTDIEPIAASVACLHKCLVYAFLHLSCWIRPPRHWTPSHTLYTYRLRHITTRATEPVPKPHESEPTYRARCRRHETREAIPPYPIPHSAIPAVHTASQPTCVQRPPHHWPHEIQQTKTH